MKINEIHCYWVRIPLKETFRHALASRRVAENVVVRVKTEEGVEGVGECVPRDYVTGETLSSVFHCIKAYFAPLLWRHEWPNPEAVRVDLSRWESLLRTQAHVEEKNMLAARCAMELALLDAAGHTFDCSATDVLGWKSREDPIYYSGVISSRSPRQAAFKARLLRWYGFKAVKLKVGESQDFEKLKRVRRALGPHVDLRVDANGAWLATKAIEKIKQWEGFGLSAVEQPVAKEDWAGMAQVSQASLVPIMADESLCGVEEAQQLAQQKICGMFNIRLSKCGGWVHAHEIYQIAQAHGIPCQLGCQVGETAILSSAGRLFAQCHPDLRFVEGSYERFLLKKDLSRNRVRFYYKGKGMPIRGKGLGVQVDWEVLNSVTQTYLKLKRP